MWSGYWGTLFSAWSSGTIYDCWSVGINHTSICTFLYQDTKISIDEKESDGEDSTSTEDITFWQSLLMVTKAGYWNHYTIILGLSIAASSFFGLLGYFMIERFDATPIFVSLAFSAQAGTSVIVQFFLLKKCYELWDEETITKFGLVIATIGYCFISFAPFIWVALIGCIFTGFGQSLVRPTTIAMLSKRNEMGQGITMGLQHSMDSLGRILGPLWGMGICIPGISSIYNFRNYYSTSSWNHISFCFTTKNSYSLTI